MQALNGAGAFRYVTADKEKSRPWQFSESTSLGVPRREPTWRAFAEKSRPWRI